MSEITSLSNEPMVKLIGSDGFINLPLKAAKLSVLVSEMITDCNEDLEDIDDIPVLTIKKKILEKVAEFCKYQTEKKEERIYEIEKPIKSNVLSEVVPRWYADYIDLDQDFLFDVILAANYLDIKLLLDLGCAKVASMLKGKTPEEIRKTFGIENDFTEEEEEQLRKDNQWIEETSAEEK